MPDFGRQTFETPLNESSRIRLNREQADLLGVVPASEAIDFMAFFRSPGELICSSTASQVDHTGVMDSILAQLPSSEEQDEITLIEHLPSPSVLTLPDRVFPFKAQWTKQQNQLHMKIGAKVLSRLAYEQNGKRMIRALIRNRFLILMSAAHYATATGGSTPTSV